jgi:hypothetical protein
MEHAIVCAPTNPRPRSKTRSPRVWIQKCFVVRSVELDRLARQEDVMITYWVLGCLGVVAAFLLSGVRIVRPTLRGLIERLGRYDRFVVPAVPVETAR